MRKKIMTYYLKTICLAVLTSIFLSLIIFFIIRSTQNADVNQPHFLIYTIKNDLSNENRRFYLTETATDLIEKNDYWIQVLDKEGNVEFEYNTNSDIPKHYTMLELVDAVSESDRIDGYSVFITKYDNEDYNVLLGCPSSDDRKIVYHTKGGLSDNIIQTVIIILIVSICVIMIMSFIFSHFVSKPLSLISNDINALSKGGKIKKYAEKEKGIFKDMFYQTELLQTALDENKNTRNEWISNISHDIKTPLATIRGYAEILADKDYLLDDKEIKKYAGEILSSEKILEGLVDDLKTYQMLSESKCQLDYQIISLHTLFTDCINSAKVYISDKDSVVIDCKKDLSIKGDEKLLKRSFINIICNAFVHNESPVTVEILVTETDLENIFIHIRDNGKGMVPEELKHIFERYYRGLGSNVIKGTGLGLSIAKEVVNAHNGSISVSSEIGKGTEFLIVLKKEC